MVRIITPVIGIQATDFLDDGLDLTTGGIERFKDLVQGLAGECFIGTWLKISFQLDKSL